MPHTKLTPTHVASLANAFCKAIGIRRTAPFAPEFEGVPARDDGSLPPYWQPTWRIKQDLLEIHVSDLDGAVVDLEAPVTSDSATLAGKGMSRARALSIARAVIKAAHINDSLAQPELDEIQRQTTLEITRQQPQPPLKSAHEYVVTYNRKALGLEFRDQRVAVRMNAETGQILGWQVVFQTPAPQVVKAKLTRDQAETTALRYLAKNANRDVDWEPVRGTKLVWVSERDGAKQPHHAALAWYCVIADNGGNSVIIPVDAITGRVVESALDMAGNFDVILPELHKRTTPHSRERHPLVDSHIVA